MPVSRKQTIMEASEPSREEAKAELQAFHLKTKHHERKVARRDDRSFPITSRPTDSTPILNVPVEMILAISEYLSDQQKACLSLTCEGLYRISGDVLTSRSLQFPHACIENRFLKGVCRIVGPWNLIRHLEDSRRWLACSLCLKLHPFSHFSPRQILFKDPETRVCRSEFCTGYVTICRCTNFTLQNKHELAESLRQIHKVPVWEREDRAVWHRCSSEWGDIIMRTEITASLSSDDDLILGVEFVTKWPDHLRPTCEVLQWACPHGIERYFTYQSLWSDGPQSSPQSWASSTCKECGTHVVSVISETSLSNFTRRTVATRNLGNAEGIPDQKWHYQAAYTPPGRHKNIRSGFSVGYPQPYADRPLREPPLTRLKALFRHERDLPNQSAQ